MISDMQGMIWRSRWREGPGGTSITRAPDLKGSGGPPSHLAGGTGQKDPVAHEKLVVPTPRVCDFRRSMWRRRTRRSWRTLREEYLEVL